MITPNPDNQIQATVLREDIQLPRTLWFPRIFTLRFALSFDSAQIRTLQDYCPRTISLEVYCTTLVAMNCLKRGCTATICEAHAISVMVMEVFGLITHKASVPEARNTLVYYMQATLHSPTRPSPTPPRLLPRWQSPTSYPTLEKSACHPYNPNSQPRSTVTAFRPSCD